jgi:hypothetical protein
LPSCDNFAASGRMPIARQNMHFCLGLATHATVIDKRQIV